MLACPTSRDDILHKTPGLKDLDCQTIFGAGDNSKLSVNVLWSNPVLKFLKRTTALQKGLGYLRPVVKNLTVFRDQNSEADLDALTSANAMG